MFPPLDGTEGLNLDYCMRLLPHHADTGGFFVAVLEKVDTLPWQKTSEENNKYCPAPEYDVNGEEPPPKKKPKAWFQSDVRSSKIPLVECLTKPIKDLATGNLQRRSVHFL